MMNFNITTKKMLFVMFIVLLFPLETLNATGYYFYVQFADKNNSPYLISRPHDFLSQRAIDRRTYYQIPIDQTDLPINPDYITQLRKLKLHIHATTKWLNGVTVLVKDTTVIQQVRTLSFVDFVQYTGLTNEILQVQVKQKIPNQPLDLDYGVAASQLDFMNARILHENGYLGNGMHVAVIDAGFYGVNSNTAFDGLRNEGRLLGTKDFVNPASDIYAEHTHGATVLATLAAELNGTFVGTAPKASYWLLRSEAATGEYLYEPDLWISAIEFADSAGVDLATTSLGYTVFDDIAMNYTYQQLDGKTARASIAANMAYNKGIMLLNSAGNDGNKEWKYISVPADAEGVITVGALNSDSTLSLFSSIGPTPDGRIKPELAVQGSMIKSLNANASAISANGTSFSTPILAGAVTCFLQAVKNTKPTHTLDDVRAYIYQSTHLYQNPTFSMGYGIPDFRKAMELLTISSLNGNKVSDCTRKNAFKLLVNGELQVLELQHPRNYSTNAWVVSIYQIDGKMIKQYSSLEHKLQIDLRGLKKGIYIVQVTI